ncbi:MAG: hypothetical protein AAGC55_05930 [Myxococcota bacterium]
MQKHPTPTADDGAFHWHPPGLPGAIRATLSDLATRERGQTSSLWIIDSSYLAWARTFSAVAPGESRRYTGIVATIAQAHGTSNGTGNGSSARAWSESLPEILSRLRPAPAAPHSRAADGDPASAGEAFTLTDPPGADRPLAVDPDSLVRLFDDRDPQLAHAVYSGGPAYSKGPGADRLPALFGRLLSWLPAAERARPRTGVFTADPRGQDPGGMDTMVHYLTAAWFCPAAIRARRHDYALACWQLVFDLARGQTRDLAPDLAHNAGPPDRPVLPVLFDQLTELARAWDTADNLRRYLAARHSVTADDLAACDRRAPSPLYSGQAADAGWLWNRLLHYWGRGFLPDRVLPQLAELLARRIAVDHLFHLDSPDDAALPERYLRRLRYEALLTRSRVADIARAVAQHLPSLTQLRGQPWPSPAPAPTPSITH